MKDILDFGAVKNAKITILVDNRVDFLLQSNERVDYFTKQLLLAEQGFSLLIEVCNKIIILDCGTDSNVLLENMRRMEIDPCSIDTVILSHGHSDHVGSVARLLRAIKSTRKPKNWESIADQEIYDSIKCDKLPVLIHPAAFHERWRIYKNGMTYGPLPIPNQDEWESLDARIVSTPTPYKIDSGCWITGYIPRCMHEKQTAGTYRTVYREDNRFVEDEIEDDQALVINVEGKGLIVITGCAHAGIVNTINYAQRLTGVSHIYAVIGGFHLAFSSDEEVKQSIIELDKIGISYVVPLHCTGFCAMFEIVKLMQDKYLQGVVGATLKF